jgi:hypothetical protein
MDSLAYDVVYWWAIFNAVGLAIILAVALFAYITRKW